jgi:hypothetical protein
MGNIVPAQFYQHLLTVLSGSDGMHDLQFHAPAAATATFTRGSLVSLNTAGALVNGLFSDTSMPQWAINAVDDYDANSERGGTVGGNIGTFVATGGFEIKTTEYVAGSYPPGTLLRAATSTDAGKVKAAANNYNDDTLVGAVSVGTGTDVYGQGILSFWPIFIPKHKAT